MVFGDNDIKIVGNKPSLDVEKNRNKANEESNISASDIKNAKQIGKRVADIYISDVKTAFQNNDNAELLMQRQLLLSFVATIGFEQYISDDALVGIAQKSFLDTIKSTDVNLYVSSSDTGAFSFYYLAYRRGTDVERRIGETFAMLCSHDGDPIFEELGEALYCWFSSVVKSVVKEEL
ncbi:MAG: hypothetical protein MJ090_06010 [Clostridia bacterium]|nr:hypothetical protein [Clostridia bacterium]